MDQFVYHHIDLEHHALLLAEGAPAESYLPQNQARSSFDNGDEYADLYPDHDLLALLPMAYPRVSAKGSVPRQVVQRLMSIAQQNAPDKDEALA